MSLDPITALLDIGKTALDKFVPDPKAKADAIFRLQELATKQNSEALQAEVQLILAQSDINKIEAASSNIFVSGARPFILWTCGVSLAYVSIVEPIARFVATVAYNYTGAFPAINTDITLQLLFALLGLGAMRSYDKAKGTA